MAGFGFKITPEEEAQLRDLQLLDITLRQWSNKTGVLEVFPHYMSPVGYDLFKKRINARNGGKYNEKEFRDNFAKPMFDLYHEIIKNLKKLLDIKKISVKSRFSKNAGWQAYNDFINLQITDECPTDKIDRDRCIAYNHNMKWRKQEAAIEYVVKYLKDKYKGEKRADTLIENIEMDSFDLLDKYIELGNYYIDNKVLKMPSSMTDSYLRPKELKFGSSVFNMTRLVIIIIMVVIFMTLAVTAVRFLFQPSPAKFTNFTPVMVSGNV